MNAWMRAGTATDGEQLVSAMCSLAKLTFRRQEVPAVRRFAAAFGLRAGMGPAQLAEFVLAVSEAAACAVSHRPGTARLRMWSTGARVLCEVHGEGMMFARGPGAFGQGETQAMRRRLLRQLCDHVLFDQGPSGVTVRFSVPLVCLRDRHLVGPASLVRKRGAGGVHARVNLDEPVDADQAEHP